jgi:hypothetical protein
MGFQVQGSFAEVAYAEEYHATPASAFGTGQTGVAAANWTRFRYTRFSGGLDKNFFESNELRSDRETAAMLAGNRRADLDMSFEFGPESHMLLMRHLMCITADPWVDDATATEWTFNPGTTPPSGGLVFVKGFTDLDRYYVYKGGRVDSVSLDFPQEGIVTGSARILGTTEADPAGGVGVPPYDGNALIEPALDPFESNLTTIKLVNYDAAEVTADYLSGAAFSTAEAACAGGRISIGNSADPSSYVLSSYERYSIPFGRRRCEGSLNFLFVDDGHYDDFIAGQEKSIEIKFVQGSYYWKIILPRVKYNGRPAQDIQGEQGIRYDVPFRALRHPVVGKSVLMFAKNSLTAVTLGHA